MSVDKVSDLVQTFLDREREYEAKIQSLELANRGLATENDMLKKEVDRQAQEIIDLKDDIRRIADMESMF